MKNGLWRFNPYLLNNLVDYISLMPKDYIGELIEETGIVITASKYRKDKAYVSWRDWVRFTFGDGYEDDYYVRENRVEAQRDFKRLTELQKEMIDYYNLLFFFSGFKRLPEQADIQDVRNWMIECLVDVLKNSPFITPYPEGINEGAMMEMMDVRDSDTNIGLSHTDCIVTYETFTGAIFGSGGPIEGITLEINDEYGLITSSIITSDLPQDEYDGLLEYWGKYSGLIPLGFLSRENNFRLLNYSMDSLNNIK